MRNTGSHIRLHLMFLLTAGVVSILVNYTLYYISYLKHFILRFSGEIYPKLIDIKISDHESKKQICIICSGLMNGSDHITHQLPDRIASKIKTFNIHSKTGHQNTSFTSFGQEIGLNTPTPIVRFGGNLISINLV